MRHVCINGRFRGIDALRGLNVASKVLTVVKCDSLQELYLTADKISRHVDVTAVVCDPKAQRFNCIGPALFVFGEKPRYVSYSGKGVPNYVRDALIQFHVKVWKDKTSADYV